MRKNSINKSLIFIVILFSLSVKSMSQYSVIGPTCVVPDFNYSGYQVIGGPYGTGDKWCVTGGTINSTGNTCITNTSGGGATIVVKWNAGITTGYVWYYAHSYDFSPSATLAVNVVNNTISTTIGPYLYVPLGKPTVLSLTGSEGANNCSTTYLYLWQKSTDGTNYSYIDQANTKDYLNTESFTQTVYYRRMFVLNSVPHYSIPVSIIP